MKIIIKYLLIFMCTIAVSYTENRFFFALMLCLALINTAELSAELIHMKVAGYVKDLHKSVEEIMKEEET